MAYYDDGLATVLRGDAREVLPRLTLDPERVVIITDPVWPNAPDGMFPWAPEPEQLFAEVAALFPSVARRVVVQMGCNSDPRMLEHMPRALPFVRACWLRYQVPAQRGTLLIGSDVAYVFGDHRPPPRPRRLLPGEVSASGRWGAGRTAHPCPRTLDHVRWLVKWFTRPGDVVVDPFCGSGTTLRAAKDLEVQSVGIELHEPFCALAVERLRQDVLALEGRP